MALNTQEQKLRTAAAIRAKAAECFGQTAAEFDVVDLASAEGKRLLEHNMALVDEALAVIDGELLDLDSWLEKCRPTLADQRLGTAMLEHLTDTLDLLTLEFTHPELGVLPLEVVRAVLAKNGRIYYYKGVGLIGASLVAQYRRKPI
jgi:hypothetical protein